MSDIQQNLKELLGAPEFSWVNELQKTFPGARVYFVGGFVRDLLLERETNDYDLVVGKVKGEELQKFLEKHGKVNLVGKSFGVFVFRPNGSKLEIEIALPRTEKSFNTGGYHDFEIHSDPNLPIEKDLSRRDFTVNAMALDIHTGAVIDPHDGRKHLEENIIKTVGSPRRRFKEDYTRVMRGIRFASQLEFRLEFWTARAIKKYAPHLKDVAPERLQSELNKILLSDHVEYGFSLMKNFGILKILLPEIAENIGVEQGKAHIYTVYEHLVKAAAYAQQKGYRLEIILAALFHDCGKARTKRIIKGVDTYYNHEYVGEKMTRDALNRLRYPKETVKKVTHLVRNHMFYYNIGEISDAGVRRLIARVGGDHINDLIKLRMCDRKGMGRPKAKPYKLLELEKRVTYLQTDPISVDMLKIDGEEIMDILNIKPSARIKYVKNALLGEVLDDPKKNTGAYLRQRTKELGAMSDDELKAMAPNVERAEQERKRELLSGFKGVT